MKHHRLDDMTKGWFVGDFSPHVAASKDAEVAIKSYAQGDHEAAHYHSVATEITAFVSGRAQMLGREWQAGDIVTIEPGEVTDFTALTDVTTVVVKMPCVAGDKFMA